MLTLNNIKKKRKEKEKEDTCFLKGRQYWRMTKVKNNRMVKSHY